MLTRDIGEEHPTDFELLEEVYKKVPIVSGAINKTVDVTVSSDFSANSEDPRAKEAITKFMDDHTFDMFLRGVAKDLLIFGNCFVELIKDEGSQTISDLKILNPKTMFVKRDEYGVVQGYSQKLTTEMTPISFGIDDIAHYKYNCVGDSAYGYSIIAPIEQILGNKLRAEKAMMKLMERKANVPFHIKLGTEENPAQQADIDGFGNELHAIDEETEWVTGHNVEMNVLDFGGKGQTTFEPFLEHFENQIVYALEVPIVLLGRGNIPEGLATTQMEAFHRRINSIRLLIEHTTEEKIFQRILKASRIYAPDEHGLRSIPKVEIDWEPQTEEDRWREAERIVLVMSTQVVSEPMRKELETKLAVLFGIEDYVPEDLPQPTQQPQLPTQQNPFPSDKKKQASPYQAHEQYPLPKKDLNLTIEQWTSRKLDIQGLGEGTILQKANSWLDDWNFNDISTLNLGQKNALRTILKKGLTQNTSLKSLTDKITALTNDKYKAERIARTEVVRATSHALLEDYKEAGIDRYRWVTISDMNRCPECAALQGRVFEVNNPTQIPPLHPSCRCTLAGVF